MIILVSHHQFQKGGFIVIAILICYHHSPLGNIILFRSVFFTLPFSTRVWISQWYGVLFFYFLSHWLLSHSIKIIGINMILFVAAMLSWGTPHQFLFMCFSKYCNVLVNGHWSGLVNNTMSLLRRDEIFVMENLVLWFGSGWLILFDLHFSPWLLRCIKNLRSVTSN